MATQSETKTYPWDFRAEWEAANHNSRFRVALLWEERGPKNTDCAFISCWQTPDGVYLVQTWKSGGRSLFREIPEVVQTTA